MFEALPYLSLLTYQILKSRKRFFDNAMPFRRSALSMKCGVKPQSSAGSARGQVLQRRISESYGGTSSVEQLYLGSHDIRSS